MAGSSGGRVNNNRWHHQRTPSSFRPSAPTVRFHRSNRSPFSQQPRRLYPRLSQQASQAFLAEIRRAFPFRIRRLQCDRGKEFPFAFALAVEALGIRHRYIRPRRPQQNGKVERSHRIDHEEFWARHQFPDFDTATAALRRWEHTYNHKRFSLALKGRTPAEKLAAATAPPAA